MQNVDFNKLKARIKALALEMGFNAVGISDIELSEAGIHLNNWIKNGHHADMDYMHKHGDKRYKPEKLIPDTISIISVRMDYLMANDESEQVLNDNSKAYIARYALGRDYHKVLKKRLKKLAETITDEIGPFGYRAFTDSAPVMERAIAEKAGIGWIGKNTCVINSKGGSYFFLGELYTDLPLEPDEKSSFHCGSCSACIDVCPTKAIVAPFQLDARRCISYLTIENTGPIPLEFREAIGNRIYGCDDCQLFCPWNKFAKATTVDDFATRHNLDKIDLVDCFLWAEDEYLKKTEGMAMRRVSFESWQRNVAVALGNAPTSKRVIDALESQLVHTSSMVQEHIQWALDRHKF